MAFNVNSWDICILWISISYLAVVSQLDTYYLPLPYDSIIPWIKIPSISSGLSTQSNEFKRVEMRVASTFPNQSHFWTLCASPRPNQSKRKMQDCRPLIFLFCPPCQIKNLWKVTFWRFVSARVCGLSSQISCTEWVGSEGKAAAREKYKQKSGTNTERGQGGGGSRFLISTMWQSSVTCIWSFCPEFGKILAQTVNLAVLNNDPRWLHRRGWCAKFSGL